MSRALPDVIVLRGAPGAGKSQAAKMLAARLGRGARVEVDALRAMVVGVCWTDQEVHVGALGVACAVVAGFLRLGHRPVVVADTFSGDKLVGFLAGLEGQRAGVVVRVFTLVPSPDVLRARVEGRPAHQFKDVEACLTLNADVVRHLQPYERIIDNTFLTPEQTVDAVLAGCLES